MTPEKIIEAIQTIRNEIEPALKFNERGKIFVKVLENNLKATILNDDTINFVVSEFNKYAGKRIGTKTLEKINKAIENKSPLIYAVFNGNSIRIRVHQEKIKYMLPYNDCYVDICREYENSKDNHLFDSESKFKPLEKFYAWYKVNYINDPDSYINDIQAEFEAIQKAAEAYNKAVETFQDRAIQGLTEFNKIYPKNYLISCF